MLAGSDRSCGCPSAAGELSA